MTQVRLDSAETSLILDLSSGKIPVLSYWGGRLKGNAPLPVSAGGPGAPVFQAGLDVPYQMTLFPEQGTGFKGRPALLGMKDSKHWASQFKLLDYKIDYATDYKNDVCSAQITLEDQLAGLRLMLELQLDDQSGVLSRRTHLTNLTSSPYNLSYCASGAIVIPSFCNELMTFNGCWTGEFLTQRSDFKTGTILFENQTGRTSHENFPGMIAGTKGFGENHGTVYGTHLGWSGNACFFAQVIPDGTRQIQMSELLIPGEIVLQKNQTYTSPWVYAAYSHSGLNGLSSKFHHFLRETILPKQTQTMKRPVVFNSWEAVYFNHDLEELKQMASKAASVGFERFVLDDGWFQGRKDDTRALGDWRTDKKKYPKGLDPLIVHVKDQGMDFGLWVEPEMVSPNSELYTHHPEWILELDGFERITGRQQLVLNLCRNDVVQYLYNRLDDLLTCHDIAYLKWDMNRILTMAGHQGYPAFHRQTQALYTLIDRIKESHPDVEIETCASGGGRIDFEILKRTDRFWTSDSNDPFRRQVIQKGASLFFPPEITGSHIGPAKCHTSGRVTDIQFRILTSFFNHFGAEFNLLELDEDQEKLLKTYISLHKKYRHLLHHGRSIRLNLSESLRNGYGCVSIDQKQALFCVVQMDTPSQTSDRSIRFSHLDPDNLYQIKLLKPVDPSIDSKLSYPKDWYNGFVLPGRVLMETGISIFLPWPGTGVLIEITTPEP